MSSLWAGENVQLRLLHRETAPLARDYDDFYGTGTEAPASEVTALGDHIAAETLLAVTRPGE